MEVSQSHDNETWDRLRPTLDEGAESWLDRFESVPMLRPNYRPFTICRSCPEWPAWLPAPCGPMLLSRPNVLSSPHRRSTYEDPGVRRVQAHPSPEPPRSAIGYPCRGPIGASAVERSWPLGRFHPTR